MRIIAGSRRSLHLSTVKGMQVRPTTDRIKETIFNILSPNLPGCSFLDLFSGSGQMALEALSRGAKEAYLVEQDKDAVLCIRQNIMTTRFEQEAKLGTGDVFSVLKTLRHEPFDLIFMDPPYHMGIEEKVLSVLKQTKLVDEHTLIVVEASAETVFDFTKDLGYSINRVKSYGSNQHVFLSYNKCENGSQKL